MEAESTGEVTCPKCAAKVVTGERFCAACGAGISVEADGSVVAQDPLPSMSLIDLHSKAQGHLASARKWLLAVSILTLVSGAIFFAIQKGEVEDQITQAEAATSHMSDADRDAAMQQEIGMTWDEALAHDRGMVNMLLAVNIALAILYFVMWIWANKNPYAAAVTALLLFVTTIVVSAVIEPSSLAQGIIVKIFFTVALVKAISAGSEARKAGLQT